MNTEGVCVFNWFFTPKWAMAGKVLDIEQTMIRCLLIDASLCFTF